MLKRDRLGLEKFSTSLNSNGGYIMLRNVLKYYFDLEAGIIFAVMRLVFFILLFLGPGTNISSADTGDNGSTSSPQENGIYTVRGTSMYPLFKEGDTLLLRQVVNKAGSAGSPQGKWKIIINGKAVMNSKGEEYEIPITGYKMLSLYVDDYHGVIPKGAVLLMGESPDGSFDAARIGLTAVSDLMGKVMNGAENNILRAKAEQSEAEVEKIALVPIVDVREGDYVLSLNEETQKIEPYRINRLLDMGVKPVFRLTTGDGRSIKTTGNHPYLTKDGWRKVVELQEGIQIAVSIVDAWDGFYHSVQIKYPQLLQSKQQSTSTFLTSLFRIEPETYKHQYKESNPTAYSDSYWKTTKEIACKADRKDSLCQISKEFSNMFLTFSKNFIHWLKYNIGSKLCQETYAGENRKIGTATIY